MNQDNEQMPPAPLGPVELGLGPAVTLPPHPEHGWTWTERELEFLGRWAGELVAAERERLKADAESWGDALNQAGWAATESYRRHTGQVEPAIFFNHAKGILRDALAVYFKALRA